MLEGRGLPGERLAAVVLSRAVVRLVQALLIGLCAVAGYLTAGWLEGRLPPSSLSLET
jgi:hypothetical protein